jgi:hypothetical protein
MTPKAMRASWDLAGLATVTPLGKSIVFGPRCEGTSRGKLLFLRSKMRGRSADPSLLYDFLQLADATDEQICRFATKWGALGLCKHSLPIPHDQRCIVAYEGRKSRRSELWLSYRNDFRRSPDVDKPSPHSERLRDWREISSAFASIINIAAELAQGRFGREEDWIRAQITLARTEFPPTYNPFKDFPRIGRSLLLARKVFSVILITLIDNVRVCPIIAWHDQVSSFELILSAMNVCSSLFGILTVQLILAIGQKEGFAVCSNCGQAYIPERKPDPTRRNYCGGPRCGLRAAWRDAARERRRRQREGKDTLADS